MFCPFFNFRNTKHKLLPNIFWVRICKVAFFRCRITLTEEDLTLLSKQYQVPVIEEQE